MNKFPGNKQFAFSIFDDTDCSTVENIAPVYHLLRDLGLKTTKSVWPLASAPGARFGGCTLQDPAYLSFIHELQQEGFEIGLHNVRSGSATREIVQQGLEEFRNRLGAYPRSHANHSNNRENIYWGAWRLSRASSRLAYRMANLHRRNEAYYGHIPDSPFFWGDLCHRHIRFVRNFVFGEINLDRVNPTLPYHDPRTPLINFWFSSCEGGNVSKFCDTLRESNQDQLVEESGVCIMYAHFAVGFCHGGTVDPTFEMLMRRLARLNGWFVPVSELLDFLAAKRTVHTIPPEELARMEKRWIWYKIRVGRG